MDKITINYYDDNNLSSTIHSTTNSKILSLVTDIHSNISSINSDIIIKLHESKKEYIEDLKTKKNK
jgi:hypothetical protein